MRLFKVICVLVIGPVLGVISGFIVGSLLLPPDPTGNAAPGDGFLIVISVLIGLVLSIPAFILLARWTWRRSEGTISPS